MSEDEVVKYLYHIADEIQKEIDRARVPRRRWTFQKRLEALGEAISAVRMRQERAEEREVMEAI